MKKIVFISHGLGLYGIELFLANIFERINKEKYDVFVILALDKDVNTALEDKVRGYGVNITHICDLDSLSKKFYFFKTLFLLFRQNNYDIVHSHMDFLNGIILALARIAGIPKRICHAHNSHGHYYPTGKFRVIKNIIHIFYQKTMRKLMVCSSTERLACSDEAGVHFYGKAKSKIIYNGINVEKFAIPNTADKNHYQIVSTARCTRLKNPLFAIEVIAKLKELRSDFSYKWVGHGDLLEAAKQKALELNVSDIVEFTGPRTDIPEILSTCKVCFMPSLFEGLGISLIEAQFAGLNCVASSSIPRLADMGRTTFVSLDESAEKWAKIISDNLDMPVPALDKEKAKLFDIKHTVKQLEEIYDK